MKEKLEMVKVVSKDGETKVVWSDGVFQVIKNDEIIYQDDDYERTRYVAVGW